MIKIIVIGEIFENYLVNYNLILKRLFISTLFLQKTTIL